MEWCCSKCGFAVTADDWSLLLSMGWRVVDGGETRCVICVRKESERLRAARQVVRRADGHRSRQCESGVKKGL